MHHKLKIKLFAVQFLTVLPFLAFLFYLFDLWYDTRRVSVLEENTHTAHTVGRFVERELADSVIYGKILTNHIRDGRILLHDKTDPDRTKAREFLKQYRDLKGNFLDIAIFDKFGNVLAYTSDITPEQRQLNFYTRDYFQEVLRSKTEYIADPTESLYSDRIVVSVVVPVVTGEEVTEVVRIGYDLESLKREVETLFEQFNHKTIYALDTKNKLVFITGNPLLTASDKDKLEGLDFVRNIRAKDAALIDNQRLPFMEKEVMGSGVEADALHWIFISVQPTEDIFVPLFQIQSYIWIIVLVAMLFTISLITFFLRRVRIVY